MTLTSLYAVVCSSLLFHFFFSLYMFDGTDNRTRKKCERNKTEITKKNNVYLWLPHTVAVAAASIVD